MAETTPSRRDWRGFAFPVALLVMAEAAAIAVDLRSDSLARPSQILISLGYGLMDGSILTATYQTLVAATGGLLIGGAVGLVLGILLGFVRLLDRLFLVPIEVMRPIPGVAIIPIAMLVYGFGYTMEIAVVAFATLWPMLILARAAVLGIEPSLLEVARLLRLKWYELAVKIVMPSIVPRLFVALRLTLAVALVVAVTVEIAANPIGLGHAMMTAQQTLHPDRAFALLVWIGIVGWAVNWLLEKAQSAVSAAMGADSEGQR